MFEESSYSSSRLILMGMVVLSDSVNEIEFVDQCFELRSFGTVADDS